MLLPAEGDGIEKISETKLGIRGGTISRLTDYASHPVDSAVLRSG